MMTLTRCSSTPSADTFMNPDGSTLRTRPVSAPLPPHCSSRTSLPRLDPHGIGRQQVGDHFERARIPHFDNWLTHGHNCLALPEALQDHAVDRRHDLHRPATGRRRLQPRARALQIELGARHIELGGTVRFFGGAQRGLRRFEFFRRDQPRPEQLLLPLECGLRALERRPGAGAFRLGLAERRRAPLRPPP